MSQADEAQRPESFNKPLSKEVVAMAVSLRQINNNRIIVKGLRSS